MNRAIQNFSMFGELPAWGLYVRHAKGISFKNIKLSYKDPDFRPAIIFDDVHMINLEGLEIEKAVHANIIVLKKTDRVSFKNIKLPIDQKEAIKKLP